MPFIEPKFVRLKNLSTSTVKLEGNARATLRRCRRQHVNTMYCKAQRTAMTEHCPPFDAKLETEVSNLSVLNSFR